MADEDKTERATPKRKEELRKKGQVTRSLEVMTAFVLGAGLLGVWLGLGNMYSEIRALAYSVLGQAGQMELTPDTIMPVISSAVGALVKSLSIVFFLALAGGIVGSVVQVGFMTSWESLVPDLNRLNPISGLGNLFQKEKLIDLVKSFFKVILIVWVAYSAIEDPLSRIPYLSYMEVRPFSAYMLNIGFLILKNVLLAYVVIALLDYAFQKWQFEEKNKMSKQEVKDEYKESEGDPLVRSRIRNLQREMARRRMMAEVPKSDVVITNPTHFAVALRYDSEEMDAPRVTAKGADLVALKIMELARENNVTVYQSPPLARALFRQSDLGDPVPAAFFPAVAEILAYVYRLKGRGLRQKTGGA